MIKSIIKKYFIGRYLISLLHCLECKIMPILISDTDAVKKFYFSKTGKILNLDNPVTFSEKMNWYKLNAKNPLMSKCADKISVREYIIDNGFKENLNKLLNIYSNINEINIDDLPEKFVLKASHGSHMNIIVNNKKNINWIEAKLMMHSWIHQDIYWSGRELVYKNIPKKIIVEEYIEDSSGNLCDYKFFCFNGKAKFVQFDTGRFGNNHFRNYYDINMNFINMNDDVKSNCNIGMNIHKYQFEEMKKIAEKLANKFQFVRVDFYVVDKKIFIGELTFFHNGGITWFNPQKYDKIFGDCWKLVY